MPPPPAKLLASQLIKNSSKAGVNLAIEYATKTTAWNRTFCSPELQADFAAVAEEAKFNSDILDDTIKVTMKWVDLVGKKSSVLTVLQGSLNIRVIGIGGCIILSIRQDKDGNELPTKHLVRDKATGKVEEREKE